MRIVRGLATGTLGLLVQASALSVAHAYSVAQFEAVTAPEERQLERVRDQEISQLKIVLGRRFSESRKPDILLRLAELYVEKYRFYFFKENQIHQEQFKQGLRPKSVNHDRSRAELGAATNVCLSILRSRVPFAKLDEVYYFLGYNAEELDRHKEAAKYFQVVASRFPRSAFVPESYRNLAEYAFEAKKYPQALAYYERAAQYTKLPSYPRTLYKLAWAYFKNRRRSEALSTMRRLIDLTRGGAASADNKFIDLREEALNDIVMFFAEAGRFSEAHDYFSQISGGDEVYVKALTKLSSHYDNRGDHKLALRVNENLIAEYGERRPDLVYETLVKNIELYKKSRDGQGSDRALIRLVEFLSAHGDEVAKNSDNNEALTRTKGYLRGRATEVHKEARKKKSPKLYARAAELYKLYEKAFLGKSLDKKGMTERSEIRVYRADALLAAGQESDAIIELSQALHEEGDLKNRREAGATLLNLFLKRLDAAGLKGKGSPELERQFLEAADEFEKSFPNDKLIAELRFKRARLAAARSGPEGLSKKARSSLAEMIEKYPSRIEAAEAAHDLVADLIKKGESQDAVELSRNYLMNGVLLKADKKGDLHKYLNTILSRESFKDVQKIEKDKDYSKAAAEYERLASGSQVDAEVAYKALNNAAVSYEKDGKSADAARVYQQMLAKYPKHQAPKEDLKRLASQMLWSSRFSEAASSFLRLASMPVYSSGERQSFMRLAFELYGGVGDAANAIKAGSWGWREFCSTPSASSDCHALAIDIARAQIEAGRDAEALDHLRAYIGRKNAGTRKAEGNFMVADLYQRLHEDRKAALYYEEAALAVPRSSKSVADRSLREQNFAAHAAFILVEPYFKRFSNLKLELPQDRLKSITRHKLDLLEDLVTRYSGVVNYGDGEWGIAALERLHDAFSLFSSELENAPIPPQFLSDKKDAYLRGIHSVSAPMAARSLEYLRQGFQKGLQLRITTPTFIALTQRLSRRLPREYPPAHYAASLEGKGVHSLPLRLVGRVEDSDAESLRRPDHAWRQQVAMSLASNPKSPGLWIEFGNLEALSGRLKLARLLYEQAVALSPKDAGALNNLSVILFSEQRSIEAAQGFARAAEIAEFQRDIRLNLGQSLLAFHQFSPALEALRGLAARSPDDKEAATAFAVALLGSGQLSQAGTKLNELEAKKSGNFSLWYNWSIWAALAGTKDQREEAREKLKDKSDGLAPLEKSQADIGLAIFGGQG